MSETTNAWLGAIDRAIFDAIVTHGVEPGEMREQVEAAIVNAEDELRAEALADDYPEGVA